MNEQGLGSNIMEYGYTCCMIYVMRHLRDTANSLPPCAIILDLYNMVQAVGYRHTHA